MFARKHLLSTTVKIYKQNCHGLIMTDPRIIIKKNKNSYLHLIKCFCIINPIRSVGRVVMQRIANP